PVSPLPATAQRPSCRAPSSRRGGPPLTCQKPSTNPTTVPQAVTIQKAAPPRPISFAKPDAAKAQNTTAASMWPSASPWILAVCSCLSLSGVTPSLASAQTVSTRKAVVPSKSTTALATSRGPASALSLEAKTPIAPATMKAPQAITIQSRGGLNMIPQPPESSVAANDHAQQRRPCAERGNFEKPGQRPPSAEATWFGLAVSCPSFGYSP